MEVVCGFSTNVGLVTWMFQEHLDKSWTLAPREMRIARTSLHQANSVEADRLGPDFVFGFFENGEGGSRRTWVFQEVGAAKRGPRISKAAAVRTRKRTARGVLESDHWWTYARLVVCIRLQGVRCGVFVVWIFRLVLAVILGG